MDVLAHTLWTNAVFHTKYNTDRKRRYIAAFFGVAPDLVGFTPAFFYMLLSGGFRGPESFASTHWVFIYAQNAYNYSHSLVVFAAVFLIVALFRKGKPYWPLLGWALHICIDIPTHHGFYETPFLFPLSSYRFSHGMSWSNSTFMIINYSIMALVYLGLFLYSRKNNVQAV